jgi:2-polyprenyl-6-methoxyphenol hydroxylase-like FAD-dependent oxidoreductase
MSKPIEALVVGAGPVGLMMAAELAGYGVPCRIVDKAATRSDKSKALVLWSRSLEILESMGAVEPFLASGIRVHGASVHADGVRAVHLTFGELDSPFRFALMIPQSETERLLEELARSRGVEVQRRTELVDLVQDAEGVRAILRLADGSLQTVNSCWLLGCDGAHSAVRHLVGAAFSGEAVPNDWLLADVQIDGPIAHDEVSVFWDAEGPLLLFPFAENRFRVVYDAGAAASEQRPPDPTLEEVQAVVDRRGPGALRLSDPAWLATFRIHERKVESYRHGRVFLAGDAAHIHSPAGGQGMNTGLQDAHNLAWKLAMVVEGLGGDALLDSYHLERERIGRMVLKRTGLVTRAVTLRSPIAQYMRNRLASFLASLEVVQQRLRRGISELDIEYRDSPLSKDHAGASPAWLLGSGVGPGDRAPDVESLASGDGSPLLIFSGLKGFVKDDPRVTLLQEAAAALAPGWVETWRIVASQPPNAADDERIVYDPSHAAHQRYAAASQCMYLIRPDGYVGLRSHRLDAEVLTAYLEQVLARCDRHAPAAR